MTPPTKSAGPPNNLPLARGTFVGREEELVQVADLLVDTRLVTLTGAPGIGKTRLAVEVARAALRSDVHEDGIWLVSLAPLSASDLVAQAVSTTLSIPGPDGDTTENLRRSIGDQRILIVLDNCEHVLDAAAKLTAALLDACPNLAMLATSQERLAVAGEHVWPLSSLAIPEVVGEPETWGSAVELFEARAQAIAPTFAVDGENIAAVVDICRRLDGIPLAIELAAARVNTFSPSEIARHLDDRFAFLTGGSRAVLPRHHTLKAAVDWSYDLLDKPEQALLRRLSVFSGGATLDAIESVCTGGEVLDAECMSLMTTLVDRSLVVPVSSPAGTRYLLLETIRFYGKDRLADAGEVTTTGARHVNWCVELAETAEAHLQGPGRQDWLNRVETEHENLVAAMTWSLDQGPTEAALRIAAALTLPWRIGGHFANGLVWLERVVAVSDDAPDRPRARALWGKALMAAMLSDYPTAGVSLDASLALSTAIDDVGGIARALLLRASLGTAGDADVDIADLQHAIAMARQVGDLWCLSQALANCGSLLSVIGDMTAARQVLEEAVAVAEAGHDRQCLGFALTSLAAVAVGQGDYADAESHYRAALAVTPEGTYENLVIRHGLAELAILRGDVDAARWQLDVLDAGPATSLHLALSHTRGLAALAEGDVDTAERLFDEYEARAGSLGGVILESSLLRRAEVAVFQDDGVGAEALAAEALELARSCGHKAGAADALQLLGLAAHQQGRRGAAESLCLQALYLRIELGDRPGIAASLEVLAAWLSEEGQPEKAVRLLACAQTLRTSDGSARSRPAQARYESAVSIARAALSDDAFESAWAECVTMSPESALRLVAKRRGTQVKRPVSGVAALTDAERQVAQLLLERLTNAEIATRLFVAVPTVKTHVTRIYTKLGVTSRAEMISRYPKESL